MQRSLTILIALAMLLTTTAIAQTPVDPTVEVEIGSSNAGASIDRPAEYTVTIRNTSPSSGSGGDPPMQITLDVSGAPAGWQASVDDGAFQLAPGASATTTLRVAISGEAVVQSATITVEATIRNGAFPPLEATATATDSVEVTRDDTTSRQITEFIADYLWFIVLGGVLLYIGSTALLVLLFRKKDQGKSEK